MHLTTDLTDLKKEKKGKIKTKIAILYFIFDTFKI